MRKLHWEDFPAHFHWFCCGLSALSLFYSSIWSCRTSQRIKKGNRKVLMRPGFSNYPCTKEYLCISLTPSMYLQTPALLLCKAGAALRGYYCKSRLCSPSFPLSTIFPRILNQVFAVIKGNLFSSLKNLGIWCWQEHLGVFLFFFLPECLLTKKSPQAAKVWENLQPSTSPYSPWPISFNQRLPSPAGITKHWLVTPGVNFCVCGGKIVTSPCLQMSVWH